jgi:nucleotide-binding universal stress UspA family protein
MQKIVVGISGSEASKAALRWAVEDARGRGAEVVALHVYDVEIPSPDASPATPVDIPAIVTELHEGAERFITQIVEEVVGNTPAVDVAPSAVEDNDPLQALLDAARDADLLVVGYGLLSLECARQAACPVLIHRGEPTAGKD